MECVGCAVWVSLHLGIECTSGNWAQGVTGAEQDVACTALVRRAITAARSVEASSLAACVWAAVHPCSPMCIVRVCCHMMLLIVFDCLLLCAGQ
jgi:hypothetical protein